MKESSPENTLQRLTSEVRKEATRAVATVDWNAVEASLFTRAASAPGGVGGATRAPARHWFVPASLAALAALTVAGAVLVARPSPPAATPVPPVANQVAPSPAPRGDVDGRTLVVGAVVASGGESLRVEHAGHVTWTLAPDAVARVESVGEVVGLSLERGAVAARVTKSSRPESFVVRVEKSRIAVHGTAFRVARLDGTVRIEVDEGVLAIGRVGGPAFELRAPGSVVMSFEGVRTEPKARGAVSPGSSPPAPAEGPGMLPLVSAPPAEGAAEAGDAKAPAAPRGAQRETVGVEHVIQAVRRCLSENTVARGDLRVSVRTRLSLRVQANGRVGEAVFAPPLAPAVQACVDARVGAIGFSASQTGFALDRVIELER